MLNPQNQKNKTVREFSAKYCLKWSHLQLHDIVSFYSAHKSHVSSFDVSQMQLQ